MENTYCIYMHISPNGKVYVGQTKNGNHPEYRWGKGGINYKPNEHFYSAIQKYGWDNFKHLVIASNLTLEQANYQEEFLIREFDLTNPDKGYNQAFGGDNHKCTDKTKKKISEAHKGKPGPNKGKPRSEETKKKISESLKGRPGKPKSEETKKKMSENNVCYWKGKPGPNTGRTLSEETKQKMREARKKYYENKRRKNS